MIHPQLERFMRYQAHHDRAYERASAELLKRRKERLLAERGFVSQQRAEAHEKRREEKHGWQIKRAKTAAAIAETRLQREQTKTFTAQAHAVNQTNPSNPPEQEAIAA